MTTSISGEPDGSSDTRKFLVLLLGSIGVVYGDIGTSPLFAFGEALRPFSHDGVSQPEIIGVISLMVWTLTIIVTLNTCCSCCGPTTTAKAARCRCWRC